MKSLLIIILICFSFISCDKRKDVYSERNKQPVCSVVLLNNSSSFSSTWLNDSIVVDTLKQGRYYRFKLSLNDESHKMTFNYSGAGTLYKNGVNFSSSDELEVGDHLFEWLPDVNQVGDVPFSISMTDSYGKVRTYEFRINVFVNRVPEVSWVIEHVGLVGPFDKKIVVSGTDGDEIYGGTILYYEYVINEDTTVSPLSEFNYVFPQAGNYHISVRAMDSNNEWSNTF